MFYYKYNNKLLFSKKEYPIAQITENEAQKFNGQIFFLNNLPPQYSRCSFCITHEYFLSLDKEDLNILKTPKVNNFDIPLWIKNKINNKEVVSLNTSYYNWQQLLNDNFLVKKLSFNNINKTFEKWNINVVGLGDVGGTLVMSLRLLGEDCISKIGIYDKDINKIKRWEYECNQIQSADINKNYPEIVPLNENNLFDCDMFVFCVSIGVPEVGKEISDVRLIQFEGNSKIVAYYAKLARNNNFKGIFSVVSDPVDLLCKVAFNESNKDESGKFDFNGLKPEQIRGYGLGVMNARASYYAKKQPETIHYLAEGRAFGPHGEGLIIANSIKNYNSELSSYLTEKTKKANLEIRKTGFKPYIAPAISSGSLSLISTIKSQWHYSATFIGGVFIGSRNRLVSSGLELETYDMPQQLFTELEKTYILLKNLYN